MLRFVKVAVGDVRVVLQAGDGKEIVAIGGFPDVDEIRQLLPVIPQVAGADLDPARGAMVWMAGNAQRTLATDVAQDVPGGLIGADVVLDVERDDVRVLAAAQPVLRDLRARHHEHAVLLERPLRFAADVVEIVLEVVLTHAERAAPERREPAARASRSFFIRM